MDRQRGFVPSPLMLVGVALAVVGALLVVQTKRLEGVKAEYAAFKSNVETLGKAAEKAAREKEAADKERKEKADAENKRTVDRLNADVARLRHASSRSGILSSAPAASRRPDLACYGRSGLDAEIREFAGTATEVLGILGADAVGLNTAKRWAQ